MLLLDSEWPKECVVRIALVVMESGSQVLNITKRNEQFPLLTLHVEQLLFVVLVKLYMVVPFTKIVEHEINFDKLIVYSDLHTNIFF